MRLNAKKKIIALSTALILLLDATALSASEWFEGYGAGSSPQKWTDGGGGKYLYGGSVSYRFKRQTSYKPLVEGRLPGIKAGCAGLSISGGFLHLLGLDEIKEQLQSAAQAAMMGVVVGLVYSLPGIAEAFHKIQTYIRALQQLLSNMCNIMSKMTMEYIKNAKAESGKGASEGLSGSIGSVFNSIDSTAGDFNKAVNGGVEKLAEKIKTSFETSAEGNSSVAAKSLTVAGVLRLSNPTSDAIVKGNEDKIKAKVTGADATAFNADIKLSQLSTVMSDHKSLLFSMIFMGYYSINKWPSDDNSNKAVSESVANLMNTGNDGGQHPQKMWQSALVNMSGNTFDAFSALMYGTPSGKIQVSDVPIKLYYKKNTQDGNKEHTYALVGPSSATNETFFYDWKGLEKENIDYLKDVVYGTGASYPSIPSLLPGMNKYINTLKALKRNSTNTALPDSLIYMLSRANSALILQALLSEMESTIFNGMQVDGSDHKKISEEIEKIKASIDNYSKEGVHISEINEIFKNLEKQHTINVVTPIK